MKKIVLFLLIIASVWAAIPWSSLNLPQVDQKIEGYKFGLDLHGGVELDYLVDFSNTPDLTLERRNQILDDMKTILDGRVRRIGTTEPTLNTAYYGDETHIIVQIPTPSENDKLSPAERQKKDASFIAEAKAVIGQVVKIQFKEPRPDAEFKDLLSKRSTVVTAIEEESRKTDTPFDAFAQKMGDTYENVFAFKSGEMAKLVSGEVTVGSLKTLIGKDIKTDGKSVYLGEYSDVTFQGAKGTAFLQMKTIDGAPITNASILEARMLFVNAEPLRFRPALGKDGQILDEKHLINTIATPDQTTGRYVVNLVFDTEGQKLFGDITEKNAGGTIAIFLGNALLTAPHVSGRIDGNAIITSGSETDTKKWATNLSKNINE